MENNVFFSETGLTSTSANHISNLAKEAYMREQNELENIKFSTTKISLLGSDDFKILQEGVRSLAGIEDKINHIVSLKSLIAWLREAIKEKEKLISETRNMQMNKIAEKLGIDIPEKPGHDIVPSTGDIIDSWNIKKRNRYYYLDTVCSTIGKLIHPDGHLSKERKNLSDIKVNPNKVSGTGRDTIIYSYQNTVAEEDVDNLFFHLQNTYRSNQAELNGLKHEAEETVNKIYDESRANYAKELEAYNAKMRDITAKTEDWREKEVLSLSKLKIAIPDSLKQTYEFVSKLG